jgi:predicted DNA-binding transcriptional regulator YafY
MMEGMDTAERLLRLLGLLQRRPGWSAVELADHLEVTTRTVRRDISRLRAYGYPVEASAGHGGGYRFGSGANMPPLLLDDGEILAVTIGARLASQSAISGLEAASVSALGKLEQLIPSRLRHRLDDLDAVVFTDPRSQTPVDRGGFSRLTRAAATSVTVRFAYADQRATVTQRHVEPVRLVHARRNWFLVAFDLEREAWRTFRVDRVSDVVVTGRRFAHRDGPDPVRLVRRAAPPASFAFQALIDLDIDADTARRRIPPTIGLIEPVDEASCRLVAGTDDVEWLAGYLLGLPWSFEAHEPGELRTELRRRGGRIVRRHS